MNSQKQEVLLSKKRKSSRPITYEERLEIERLIKKGYSCGHIAVKIGRSKNGVVSEIRDKGPREVYTAGRAQDLTDKVKESKKEKLRKLNAGNKCPFFMKRRIENLEMQLKILYETIKELKNDSEN